MIIGVPKEIKNNENRVALTPAGALELSKRGHAVYVQATAGVSSGFSDDEYVSAGAKILPAIEDVYGIAEMIIKVKEPIELEYRLIQADQWLLTHFQPRSAATASVKRWMRCMVWWISSPVADDSSVLPPA